ncbi:hypothetical protein JVT61DRAFT_318 [Boletus reticuloceps]|uniref:Uncharacterized protein n=1 Tax=Boletus reticuloceps TaxID=495285 RepID=A0A8I2YZL5_9AGAM|nr:hypothetical protein JVT61DRAFT_318 [Boletus reticuloceps]
MGRPLYSRNFITTPSVRDPEPPSYERWSYLNAFDPDSDEFFDNENAVYEDFIDPGMPVNLEDEEEMEGVEEEEERDMLVVRMGNVSPITSESSLSDDESPLSDDAEDPAPLVVNAFRGTRQMDEDESEPAVRVRLAMRTLPTEERYPQTTELGPVRRHFATRGARRVSSYRSYPQRAESLPVPTPSAPIPVPTISRRSPIVDERPFTPPSTPPRQTPVTHFSMSPPPASTPRLYTWARSSSHSASPSPASPFTNPHARTSYTHLSPALIRIRDLSV